MSQSPHEQRQIQAALEQADRLIEQERARGSLNDPETKSALDLVEQEQAHRAAVVRQEQERASASRPAWGGE